LSRARVREVREACDKDKAQALAKKDSESDEKVRKLLEQVHSLERKLEERRLMNSAKVRISNCWTRSRPDSPAIMFVASGPAFPERISSTQ